MPLDESSIFAVAIEKLDNKFDKVQEELKALREMLSKQDVLLEKITNMENNSIESNKRIHKRIDDEHIIIQDLTIRIRKVEENQMVNGCPVHIKYTKERDELANQFKDQAKELEDRLKLIENKPKDRMEIVIKAFLGALGVGIYTWIITHFKG